MDDWVALAPTRWKLRRAIKTVNQTLHELKLGKLPDKTFIGRIGRGLDFLGYRFSPRGLGLAPQTLERYSARMARLYTEGADRVVLGQYSFLVRGIGRGAGGAGHRWHDVVQSGPAAAWR